MGAVNLWGTKGYLKNRSLNYQYLMNTPEDRASSEAPKECPLCGAPLRSPDACDRCDWIKGYRHRSSDRGGRDLAALLMSVVPGLGHLYKGQLALGVMFLVGTIVAVIFCSLVATFTMGFGLLLLPLYWIWVMTQAYWVPDLRGETSGME
jgi:hypothetical protein